MRDGLPHVSVVSTITGLIGGLRSFSSVIDVRHITHGRHVKIIISKTST